MKTPNWVKKAFTGTDVHWSKSQTQISKLLNELDIFSIRFTNMKDRSVLEFVVQVNENEKPRAVRISNFITDPEDESRREKQFNIVHRMLLAYLRAKFIAIGRDLKEFEQEFMSDLIVTDKSGRSVTMGEMMLPQYRQALESGESREFNLLGDGK